MARGYVPPGHPLIEIYLHCQGGQPCFTGSRMPVGVVVSLKQQGYLNHQVIAMYPHVSPAQIEAALAWAADPDHPRITRNALRRQRYRERRQR